MQSYFVLIDFLIWLQNSVACCASTLSCIMSQNGQMHFKNLAAFAARFLKCVCPSWDIMYQRVNFKLFLGQHFSNNSFRLNFVTFSFFLLEEFNGEFYEHDLLQLMKKQLLWYWFNWFMKNYLILMFWCYQKQMISSEQNIYVDFSKSTSVSFNLFKVNNRNTRTMFEISSKLVIKIPKQRDWHRMECVFCKNAEYIGKAKIPWNKKINERKNKFLRGKDYKTC